MNCPKCGEELLNVNGKYLCSKCGIEVPESQAANGPGQSNQNQNNQNDQTPPIPDLIPTSKPTEQPQIDTVVEEPSSVAPDGSVATEMPTIAPEPMTDEKDQNNLTPTFPPPGASIAQDNLSTQSEISNFSNNLDLSVTTQEKILPQQESPSINPETTAQEVAPAVSSTMATTAEPNMSPNNKVIPNTNIVQNVGLQTTPSQEVNTPITEDEGLSKRKKLFIILGICGGGLAFLIIGLLVGFFVNL